MRLFLLPLLLLAATTARAEPASAKTLLPLFELAGIHLLCEQTVPMLQRGQGEAEQKRLAQLFAGETFCLDLARRVGKRFDDMQGEQVRERDRKSTRLNSSHVEISYAVFCL